MKPSTQHRLPVGLIAMAMVVGTGCAQPPREQLGAAQEAVDIANVVGATEYAKEDSVILQEYFARAKDELAKQERARSLFRSYRDADKMLIKVVEFGGYVAAKAAHNKDLAKKDALAMEQEAQEIVASDKERMTKVPTWNEQPAIETIKQDLEAMEINLGAVHQLIDKGDYFGAEAQARALKEKGLAIAGRIQDTFEKARSENVSSRGADRFGHHDARRIISNYSTCEAGLISPMRKTVIRAVDRVLLAEPVHFTCHDESL